MSLEAGQEINLRLNTPNVGGKQTRPVSAYFFIRHLIVFCYPERFLCKSSSWETSASSWMA